MGLRRRLALWLCAFATVLLAATLVPLGLLLTRAHARGLESELVRMGQDAADAAVSSGALDPSQIAARFDDRSVVTAAVLGPSGRAVWLPDRPELFPVASAAPEIRGALSGDSGTQVHRIVTGERRVFAAVPIVARDKLLGVLWLSASQQPARDLDRRTWEMLAGVGLAVLVMAALAGAGLAGRLTERLRRLADAARRFGEQGALSERIPLQGSDEVADVTRALNEMAARIEAHMAQQSQFVAAASHQIRTPLTSIRLRIDELRTIGLADDLAAEYLEEMSQEARRLERLTVQLLALLSTEGHDEVASVAVADAVDEAVRRAAPVARHRRVHVEVDPVPADVVVAARRGALEEVLLNLVDNAVKYSPEGGEVRVASAVRDDAVEVAVVDWGPGMDPDVKERAFDAFYRNASSANGFGLGLAIAKRICDVAGADISLGSRPGGGTVAKVVWPGG